MAEGRAAPAVEWWRLEAAIINGFRQLRDRYLQRGGRVSEDEGDSAGDGPLERLPADMHLHILSFLTPQDLCRLGMTSHYWNEMVQDRLLWKYFLLRDLPSWSSIDWHSLPDVNVMNSCLSESQSTDLNYMSFYLKACPKTRKSIQPRNAIYGAVTSFFQSLVMQGEPRFALFGPGLEQLDDSLVIRMMTCPDLQFVDSVVPRHIDGIGSGLTFQLNSQDKFNILTLYSTTRTERDRARTEQIATANKMFLAGSAQEGDQKSSYTLIPQVKEVCRVVEGFIYVANAEARNRCNREEEVAHIMTMIDPQLGPQRRPLLVLACVTDPGTKRISCVHLAYDLCLSSLNRPWMVQNADVSTLCGLFEGINWILGEVGKKL